MAAQTKPGASDWEQAYDCYFPLLFRYSLRFTADRDIIKDLLQDLFLDLYLKRELPGSIRNLRSYLLVSVRRNLLKRLSREAARRMIPFSEESNDFLLELSAESRIIAGELLESRSHYLQKAVDSLTRRQKEAVYLRFYENLSYDEIGEIMGMKEVKYARTLIYRAISEMKATLKKAGSPICLALLLSPRF
ncbi:RNA polymerase sigma factor (sigma-70 family) [Anseongella ginsenosidimutans]|uniref:RNA polymerase sigma factor (Sigma-70 family) n=1 Tax=Anseongella ginsenosidimutans TaxID=496056 RepID=A0A4R3KNE5_9SPHI|nr:RNA polymerase sigma factor [Anseongella ginsenosidimutans]QEC52763.1 RNA polymerase sigma factor [Anseongella ginsenosidimutans]TCS85522.1 RNA polymerase sigma factor (sigma-70 family) [Anseongella ginsenosidimutans]